MRLLVAPTAALLLCAFLAASSHALLVAPSSQCAVQCGNVLSSTSGSDLTCTDSAYAGSVTGQTFQSCIACELNSTYVDPTTKQSDLQWLLYNLRYTVSWCLWGYPNNTGVSSTPCVTSFACGLLQSGVEYDSLSTNDTSGYGYCSNWRSDLLTKCTTCLQQIGNENYIANFIIALTAGCQQQPTAGQQISIQGSLFQSTLVNITNPTNNTLPTYYYPPSGSLTLTAKVGIAVGALVGILLVTGCFIVCRGKRRRRAHLKKLARASYRAPEPAWMQKEWNSPESETSRAFMAQDNQRWDDSPMSARGSERVFSPYVSQYTSPTSPEGGNQFPPVPIPLPYDQRGSKTDVRQTEQEMRITNAIEMNQIRPTSSFKAPIIKAPVPVVVRQPSPEEPTASSSEKKPGLGTAL